MDLEELVRRIRTGDKTAIRDLISVYGNSVYARAFERTHDKELAREAARQTFGQFVSVVQQQPDEDGWSLWFGDLIERNIAVYAQVGSDMGLIENELEKELYGEPVSPVAPPARPLQNSEPLPPAAPAPDKAAHSSGRSVRDEVFDEAYALRKVKPKRAGSHPATVILLILVCALLLWVVGGVAMTMKWIPFYDLGYSWFNAHIFQLF